MVLTQFHYIGHLNLSLKFNFANFTHDMSLFLCDEQHPYKIISCTGLGCCGKQYLAFKLYKNGSTLWIFHVKERQKQNFTFLHEHLQKIPESYNWTTLSKMYFKETYSLLKPNKTEWWHHWFLLWMTLIV